MCRCTPSREAGPAKDSSRQGAASPPQACKEHSLQGMKGSRRGSVQQEALKPPSAGHLPMPPVHSAAHAPLPSPCPGPAGLTRQRLAGQVLAAQLAEAQVQHLVGHGIGLQDKGGGNISLQRKAGSRGRSAGPASCRTRYWPAGQRWWRQHDTDWHVAQNGSARPVREGPPMCSTDL